MFNADGGFQQQLGQAPTLPTPDQGSVTRFAGQALSEPRQQPLEVQFGSKSDLKQTRVDLRDRGRIQGNVSSGPRGLKDSGSIRNSLESPTRNLKQGDLRPRGSIRQNQRPGGHLEPTQLEGFST